MRRAVINKVTISLSERSWKALERRFNLKNEGPKFIINKPCICGYYKDCVTCPLFEIPRVEYSYTRCLTGLKWVLGESKAFETYESSIEWDEQDDETARRQINRVHSFLLGMEKEVKDAL